MNIRNLLLVAAAFVTAAASAVTFESGRTEIVIAPDVPKAVAFAAKEMKHFLGGVFGADVPVVNAPTAGNTPVFLGANEWTKAVGIDVGKLARDAFRIVVTGKGAFIAGRDDPKADPERALGSTVWPNLYERATLFGAYEFLERYAGVRMYFPGELGEIMPRKAAISVPAADLTVVPSMTEARKFSYFGEGVWYEGEKRDVAATGHLRWLNMYRLRMSTDNIPFCHGLSHRGYLERFAGSHPEYFQLKADGTRNLDAAEKMHGKLCFTSKVWEEICLDSLSYLKGEPPTVRGIVSPGKRCSWWYGFYDRKYIDLMPQDGMCRCTCPNCEAAYDCDDPGNYMDTLIWTKTAEVARRLKKECPGCIVTQMAYQPYRRVPDVDLPDNVRVMVAERGPWSIPYRGQAEAEVAEVAAWAKKLGRPVSIWTYPLKYGARIIPSIPDMAPWQWGTYFKMMAPHCQGLYAESNTDRFLYKHLDYYVLSRICWDASVDPDAVIDEYFRLMYGRAETEMKRVFRSLQNRWTRGVLTRGVDTMWGPSFQPAPKSVIWTDVYSPKVLDAYDRLFREARAKTAEGSLERRRVELMHRELIEPLRAAAAPQWEHFRGLETCRYTLGSGERFRLAPRKAGKDARTIERPVKTEVGARIAGDRLEIDIACEEPRMDDIVARASDFDYTGMNGQNMVEVIVSTSAEPVDLYILQLNSSGTAADMCYRRSKNPAKMDIGWNSGGDFKSVRGANGWTGRMSVPTAAFPGLGDRFRVEIIRHRVLKGETPETYNWSPVAARYDVWDDFGTWLVK